MADFTRVLHIGRGSCGDVFCKIRYTDGRLSITGVEGPRRGGNCRGSAGQIVMSPWEIRQYATGWTTELETKFRAIWNRWHLNDMRAGSPAQSECLRKPENAALLAKNRLMHFETCLEILTAANLQPDPGYLHNNNPYSYGCAWLREEIPLDVLTFLQTLPEGDETPAWV